MFKQSYYVLKEDKISFLKILPNSDLMTVMEEFVLLVFVKFLQDGTK